MKIRMQRDYDSPDIGEWFMRLPVDGPAYVATVRTVEALRRVIGGELNWRKDNGAGYRSMYADGSER